MHKSASSVVALWPNLAPTQTERIAAEGRVNLGPYLFPLAWVGEQRDQQRARLVDLNTIEVDRTYNHPYLFPRYDCHLIQNDLYFSIAFRSAGGFRSEAANRETAKIWNLRLPDLRVQFALFVVEGITSRQPLRNGAGDHSPLASRMLNSDWLAGGSGSRTLGPHRGQHFSKLPRPSVGTAHRVRVLGHSVYVAIAANVGNP